MRAFKLQNAEGNEFDLMRKDAFFNTPDGLGFTRSIETVQAGHDFIVSDNELDQKTITGQMVFRGYQQYQEFVAFCARAPLAFCYKPLGEWNYIDCHLESIAKSEIQHDTFRLQCDITLLCTSTWYKSSTLSQTEVDDSQGKKYSYTYPYQYRETASSEVDITITGTIESPCRMHIMGPVENPTWALVQGGKVVARGGVAAIIPAGNKLVVDSSPAHLEIAEYTANNDLVRNLYQQSDFSKERFIYLPPGNSKITFSGATGDILAILEVRQFEPTV